MAAVAGLPADLSLQDLFLSRLDIRDELKRTLSTSQRWHDVAVELSKVYGKIDGDWIEDIKAENQSNHRNQADCFLTRVAELPVSIYNLVVALDEARLGVLSGNVANAARALSKK